jgi:hypothetical protein
MASGPYVSERQSEYWTSREVETFFENTGFEITAFPITQLTEKRLPTDFLFLDGRTNKLFGFQYKALYHNGEDFWKLDRDQHGTLQSFDWIYYGLSDLISVTQRRNALHYLRIVPATFPYDPHLTRQPFSPRYFRWASFFEGLRDCKNGRRVNTAQDLTDALWPYAGDAPREIEQFVSEIFLVDFDGRRARRFSALVR